MLAALASRCARGEIRQVWVREWAKSMRWAPTGIKGDRLYINPRVVNEWKESSFRHAASEPASHLTIGRLPFSPVDHRYVRQV